VKVPQMTRMIPAVMLTALFVGGPAAAQEASTQKPAAPATQKPAPAAPSTQKPATPTPPATPPTTPQKPAAPPQPFPADAKIGFVNLQMIVSESKLGKIGQEKVQALLTKQNADRAARNAEIQKLQQEIQAGATVLTPQVLQQKSADVDRLTRQAQFDEQQRQADLNSLQGQLLDELGDKVMPIIEQIRAEKGLWLILTPSGDGSGVAAVNPAIDLSAEVVKRLDAAK
jgi:outer membrane protein